MATWVKNLVGTSGKVSDCCDSWLGHYWKNGGTNVRQCGAHGCTSDAAVGAHVLNMHGNAARNHFIVPFCQGHNMQIGDEIRVKDHIALVLASYCRKRR